MSIPPLTFAAILVVAIGASLDARAQTVVPPLPAAGPYPVACTNVEQDVSRIPPGDTVDQYWRGVASNGTERYVDALLVAPANALTTTFVAPNDSDLYDRWANTAVTYVYLACYPTTTANTRADYVVGGATIPKMQRGADAPILPATPARWPVLLYSHGYGGSPLNGEYLGGVIAFASWGYVVVAPFHGDLRYSVFGPDSSAFAEKLYIPIWSEFVAMQSTRPLSLSAGLDLLLARPEWKDHVDAGRVGAFGISQGGETLMLEGGAELVYGLINGERKRVTLDTRIRAAVGYIPYFGIENLPAFGSEQAGAAGVTLPFFALSGSSDPVAPADVVRAALDQMSGVRGQVIFNGLSHSLNPTGVGDIITWSLGFLAAWVTNDAPSKEQLVTVDHVDGGLDDRKVLYVDPTGGGIQPGIVVTTIEYYNAALDHYFITAFPDEAAMLDAGVQVPGWKRTGYTFPSWQSGTGPGDEACRFFGTPGVGPNSHFYTISVAECDEVKQNPDWTFEALAFRAVAPLANGCSADYQTVTRLYNNGMGGQANHRYLTDQAAIDATVARGWIVEGPVFCVPK